MSEKSLEAADAQNESQPLPKTRRILLVATLACAGFLNICSVQSAVIMLPEISRDLDIPPARQQWLTSAYNIAFGCSLLTLGRLADLYGRRLAFLCGMLVVTIAATAIPFSPTESAIDGLRAFQGLGGAATVPSAIGILGSTFPTPGKQKNYAFITYTAASSLGSVMGNIFGGVIGSSLTWKWVFWITALIAASIAIVAFWLIPPNQTRAQTAEKPTVDYYGAALITISFVLLLFALSEGNTAGWRKPWIIFLIVFSVVLALCFWFLEQHLEHANGRSPLLKPSMFSNSQFTAAFLVIISFFASYNSYLVFATFFFQDYKGLTALQTAIRFLPSGIAGFIICFATARLLAFARGFHLLLFALACGITSPLLFAIPIPPATVYWAYAFPAMCLCISADVLAPTINLFVVRQLPPHDQAMGGALIQTSNQLGRALGLAISTAVEVAIVKGRDEPGSAALLRGIRAGEWVNVGFAVAALLIVIVYLRDLARVGAK